MMLRALTWFSLIAITIGIQYECSPYPVTSMCIIEYMSYTPGDRITFPAGYQHYRIKPPRSFKKITSNVTTFDQDLYEAMHWPSSVEMTHTAMNKLILPPKLMLGNFAENRIATVNVSSGEDYQITYLDLKFNRLDNIDFVSDLVNLEMLHLEHNFLKNLPSSVFIRLTKLKYLYLTYTYLKAIPWDALPGNLIHFDCGYCNVESADFSNVHLQSLNYLNLQNNALTTINVTALLRAAPNLKEAYLDNTLMGKVRMENIMAELAANNISSVDFNRWWRMCDGENEYEDNFGNCVREQAQISIGQSVALTAMVIVIAVLFLYIIVIVFRHMNK
ncbi:uncharacterized protein LOC134226705 [Armigeres subalbatus]|uniref:uncharacterized protein LOC134226705 n=1 Tax=Armigeres subalbatus TaxID=124917 RepID=UPI002ED64FE0